MDIKELLISWLESHGDYPTYGEIPDPRPEQFCVIGREGGGRQSYVIDSPLISVQCFAPEDDEAAVIAQKTADLLDADLEKEDEITGVSVNSIHEYHDVSGGVRHPCWQVVCEISTY